MKANRSAGLTCIGLLILAIGLFLFALAYVVMQPQPRVFAQTQQALTLDDMHLRTAQGDVFLVQAPGQPAYTCTGCTITAENTAPAPGYRATLNIRLSERWELIALQDGQIARAGNAYTQRLPLMGKQ